MSAISRYAFEISRSQSVIANLRHNDRPSIDDRDYRSGRLRQRFGIEGVRSLVCWSELGRFPFRETLPTVWA
jgi:hypothetical protein